MKSIYTVPKVNKTKEHWFAYFRYDGKLLVYKRGLNFEKDLKKREKNFNLLCEALHKRLKEGWNPLLAEHEVYNSTYTIVEALRFGLDKKKATLAPKTHQSYRTAINYFIDGVNDLRMQHLLIADTKRVHVKHILERTQEIKSWSNKAYNKNMGYIKAVFGELIEWNIIEHSPAYKIRKKKEQQTEAHMPPTDEEAILIKNKLLAEFPPFWDYMETIFHTGIRPEELLFVTVDMVKLDIDTIKMPPEITKTDTYRNVTINKHLKELLIRIGVDKMPGDYFIFGTKRLNKNRPLDIELDFMPGPRRLNRDCASDLWRKLVKIGLGLDITMYSFKKLGADKKILAGIELDALRELYGHTSKFMTLKYVTVLKEINRKQILDKSPSF